MNCSALGPVLQARLPLGHHVSSNSTNKDVMMISLIHLFMVGCLLGFISSTSRVRVCGSVCLSLIAIILCYIDPLLAC